MRAAARKAPPAHVSPPDHDGFVEALARERRRRPVWAVERLVEMGALSVHHWLVARRYVAEREAVEPSTPAVLLGERTSAQYDRDAPHRAQLARIAEVEAIDAARRAAIDAAPGARLIVDCVLSTMQPSLAELQSLPGAAYRSIVTALKAALDALSDHYDGRADKALRGA